ncbi:hypothetical protein EC968_006483 [Mortierella alpina]|nr:hypothetical protein EC968_006483 [Mortierella alpina]
MKRSYVAILLAAIAALALISTTGAHPIPEESDPASTTDDPLEQEHDTRNQICKADAQAERVDCMNKLTAKSLKTKKPLADDWATECEDEYVDSTTLCDYLYKTSWS